MHPLNFATLPRTLSGSHALLEAIFPPLPRSKHPRQLRPFRRVLLAGSGAWYNLHPFCSNGTSTLFTHSSANGKCVKKVANRIVHPEDIILNHSHPWLSWPIGFTERMKWPQSGHVPEWGWYSWGRRLCGTATAAEYGEDLQQFIMAAEALGWTRTGRVDVHHPRLLWMETTPQHFAPDPSQGCQAAPRAPDQDLRRLPHSVERACRPPSQPNCVADWRNTIANPLLRKAGISVVPLSEALSARADLHTAHPGDCTHWCDASEASLIMAHAVLTGIAAALQGKTS